MSSTYLALLRGARDGRSRGGCIPRCKGDGWRSRRGSAGPSSWEDAYRRWMNEPASTAASSTSITFDFRRWPVSLDVEPTLESVIASARTNHLLVPAAPRAPRPGTAAADRVLQRPRRGCEHAGRLDIKHGGITTVGEPGTDVFDPRREGGETDARSPACRRGIGAVERGTTRSPRGGVPAAWQTRLEHQATQVRAGVEPDDFVDPRSLGPIARLGLKEAFKIVASEQKALAAELAHA